jgi:hypothetical protein
MAETGPRHFDPADYTWNGGDPPFKPGEQPPNPPGVDYIEEGTTSHPLGAQFYTPSSADAAAGREAQQAELAGAKPAAAAKASKSAAGS